MPRIGWTSSRKRRLGHLAWVVLFFACTSTFYTYPLLFQLRTAIMTGGGDYLGESALIAWSAHQLLHDPRHLFDSQFYYPHSETIAYGQSLLFPGLLAVPAFVFTDHALLVANVLMFLFLVGSGVLTYGLAFSLTGKVVPSLLAGVVFAYIPNRMDHLGQFTVQTAVFLPLVVWTFHRFLQWNRWRDLLLMVFGIWAQILSSLYYGFALGFLLLGLLVACLLLRPQRLTWPLVTRGALGLGLLGAALAPFLKPYLDLHRDLGLQRDVGQAEWFGMDLLSILDPGVFDRLYRGHLLSLNRSEGGLFPGFVVLALAGLTVGFMRRDRSGAEPPAWVRAAGHGLLIVLALCLLALVVIPASGGFTLQLGRVTLLRAHDLTLPDNLLPALGLAWVWLEGRRRRQGPFTPREWVIALVFLSVLTYELTLAPTIRIAGHPWGTALFRWVFFHVPGGSAFRAPGRWGLVFVLPLALLAAFGLRAVAGALRGRWATLVPILLFAGLMVEYVDAPLHWDRQPEPPPVYRWLAQEPGDFAVLELPTYTGNADPFYMYWDTLHWKRLVNGAIGFVPATIDEIVAASDPFDGRAFVARLQAIFPLRYVLVHRASMTGPERLRWEGFRSAPPPGLQFVRSLGPDDVYAVAGTPEVGVELVRYFSTDFVERHPDAAFDVRFRRDPEVRQWLEVSLNERPLARVDTDGLHVVRLPPPYRVADRNELRFRHRYRLAHAAVTDWARYRIGRTGVIAPADIVVASAGKEAGDVTSIRLDSEEVSPNRRGYNLVVLDAATGRLLGTDVFDTFRSRDEAVRMARAVESMPVGRIVIGAVRDEASNRLSEAAVQALRALGVAGDLRGKYRQAHAFIGVKGANLGDAVEAFGRGRLSVRVGRERPAAMLQSFTLQAASGL